MLLVATHTKTCQQTGEYTLLVKRGWSLSSVREERTEAQTFPFQIHTQTLKMFPESWMSWSSEEKS